MGLSKRLQTIADMVSAGGRLVDIGTDHGYIPIDLIQRGQILSALAMDIGKGPLERAKEHVASYGLETKISCRLSNGFEHYQKGESDTAVIAGMGGDLMEKILEGGKDRLPEELILQPQSEWHKVRRFLADHGYGIVEEKMVIDDGKYYVVMKAITGKKMTLNELEEKYGPYLLSNKDEILFEYLKRSMDTYTTIRQQLEKSETQSAQERVKELNEELEYLKGAMAYYE